MTPPIRTTYLAMTRTGRVVAMFDHPQRARSFIDDRHAKGVHLELVEERTIRKVLRPADVRRVGVPCLIGVTLDIDELLKRLGEKALKSKGKRATAFHGALVVQVKEMTE